MSNIEIYQEEKVIHIQLNRPDCLNSLNDDMVYELNEWLDRIEDEEQLLVLLSGRGEGFCSGGNLSILTGNEKQNPHLFDQIAQIVKKIYLMPKLVVSAVHGPCIGIGLSLALASDYVLAHKQAQLSMNFYRKNRLPLGGGKFWLKRRLGPKHSRQWVWKEKDITGEEAYRESLIDEVVHGPFFEEVNMRIQDMKREPVESMITAKLHYHRHNVQELEEELRKERHWDLKMEA
ncbi:MAG: enoyl-CoA hydratase/isomerase family protein [Bacillaceae bacterium]|nr:enoyl-CoA hydratase/isomerase family protein [Bacillaceae bacterium]